MEPSLNDIRLLNLPDFNSSNVSCCDDNNTFPEYGMPPYSQRDPLTIVIPVLLIYCLIFVTGVIGNVSTCIVIARTKSMHTATNYYLFSLAISDFVLAVSSIPIEIWYIWNKNQPYIFGEPFCVIRGIFAEASSIATVLTVLTFTIERYVAICHPFLSHTLSKLSRAIKLIILVWLVSFGWGIAQAFQFGIVELGGMEQCVMKNVYMAHSFEVSTFLFFFFPMSVISILYILIGLKLRASTRMKRESGSLHKRHRPNQSQSTRRVIKMLVCVVVTFFFCWAPFHAQRLIYIYGTGNNHQGYNPLVVQLFEIMTYVSGILYYLSTCINPLLYNALSHKYRQAFKETLAAICNTTHKKHCEERSYRILSRSNRGFNGVSTTKQDSSEYSGNSYRDGSLYVSSLQKPSFEAIAVCYEDTRSVNRDRYISKVVHMSDNHSEGHQLSEFADGSGSSSAIYATTTTATSGIDFQHQINIFAGQSQEIFLNILPSNGEVTQSDIKIKIDIPRNDGGKTAADYSVIYNKQGTVQISVMHDSNFKLKHVKRSSFHRSSLLRFIKFKRSGRKKSSERNKVPHVCQPSDIRSVQQMLNDDLIRAKEMGRNRLRPNRLLDGDDSDVNSGAQENELDAYMREVRVRTG